MTPKPRYLRSNPRLPKRRAVTIAIGLHCNEGTVLAADSQETISYMKQDVGKLHTIITDHCIVSFAGAGDSSYIHTASAAAIENLHKATDFRTMVSTLETGLLGFFDKHIAPWASFSPKDRPDAELLMGVTMRDSGGGTGLYHYDGTAFHSVSAYSIGTGMLIAEELIKDYSFGNHTLNELVKIAVYVLSKTKRQVDGCGGFTNILCMRGGDFTLCENKGIEAMEQELREKEKKSIKAFKKEILGFPDFD